MFDQILNAKHHLSPKATRSPTIKGIFVNSHLNALRHKCGEAGIEELGRRMGKKVRYTSFEAVAITEEVELIETALDILHDNALQGPERTKAAGQLHFLNFAETSLGSALMHSLPHTKGSFKTLMHNAPSIAHIVFSNMTFRTEDTEGLHILIDNCDYPLLHFQGFLEEWMHFWGLKDATVRAETRGIKKFSYTLSF